MSLTGVAVSVDPAKAVTVNKSSLRTWLSIDATGKSMMLDVGKYAILRRVQIHGRDLRILDPKISSPPTILVRERAIVVNVEHIKVLITAQEVLLPASPNPLFAFLVEEFVRRLNVENRGGRNQADWQEDSDPEDDDTDQAAEKDEYPFEFRAFEVALEAIYWFFNAETTELETLAYPALDKLTSKINTLSLNTMRSLKKTLTKLTVQVQKAKDELAQLLDNDSNMAALYLSRKLAGASSDESGSGHPISGHPKSKIAAKISKAKSNLVNPSALVHGEGHDINEIETLLEAYYKRMDITLNKLLTLREYIEDTEDYINIQLDSLRNKLITFELILSVGSICVSVYSLVCGILGMNIPFSWNKKEYMFKWVVSVTGTLCAVLFVIIMSYARYKRLVGT